MVAATPPKKLFNVTLRVWRQPDAKSPGKFVDYPASNVNPDMSFLELLDVVNDELTRKGEDPIAFAHDSEGNNSLDGERGADGALQFVGIELLAAQGFPDDLGVAQIVGVEF